MNTKALRQKVLDLAIHGKLVPQNPKDESATVLLEKIRAEKAEKIKKGELKADKKDSFIFVGSDKRHYEQFADGTIKDIEDEIPFEVPVGWAWCRLGEICSKLVDGDHNPPKGINEKTEYLMISSRNINHNKVEDLENVRYLTKDIFDIENKRTNLQIGDILFTSVGSLGRSCVYKGGLNLCFQRSVTIIHTNQYNYWLKYYFDSDYYQAYILDNATGTAQLGFYLQQMEKSFIPIPPLSEQERIVKSIENYFEQINSLEENKTDLENIIKQTKSKILDLAIHGKLVPQDPNDEPAEELLKRIATSDNRPYKKFDDEEPFEIPNSWTWCRLKEICELKGGKRIPAGLSATKEKTNHIYIRVTDMQNNSISDADLVYITNDIFEKIQRYTINKDDLYLTIAGTIGRVGEVPEKFDGMNLTENALKLTNISICKTYLMQILNTKYVQDYFESTYHQVAMPKLSLINASKTIIPIPPFTEQQRIVSKIEELFEKLDIISKELTE